MSATYKTALVTGGAKRIGRATAADLARRGFTVAIHCRSSRTDAEALAAKIRDHGGRADVFEADLTHPQEIQDMFEQVVDRLGPIDLLVNNASIFGEDELQSFDWDMWEEHFAVHVKAPVLLSRLFAQALPASSSGLIVNMIDQRVWKLTPRFFTYTLSKSTLWTATQTMAQALAPRIRVNAIGPGPTLLGERQSKTDFDAQVKGVILERAADLSEFGATIAYLWNAASVTGQMIALDGGQHLAWKTPDIMGMRE
ncbi:MAG TPA: SDR family oxidoreductase [Rhizobiaceae bacterium]|nr:SDR family oxidoreductase [Rhizobiaceae bacterium]